MPVDANAAAAALASARSLLAGNLQNPSSFPGMSFTMGLTGGLDYASLLSQFASNANSATSSTTSSVPSSLFASSLNNATARAVTVPTLSGVGGISQASAQMPSFGSVHSQKPSLSAKKRSSTDARSGDDASGVADDEPAKKLARKGKSGPPSRKRRSAINDLGTLVQPPGPTRARGGFRRAGSSYMSLSERVLCPNEGTDGYVFIPEKYDDGPVTSLPKWVEQSIDETRRRESSRWMNAFSCFWRFMSNHELHFCAHCVCV